MKKVETNFQKLKKYTFVKKKLNFKTIAGSVAVLGIIFAGAMAITSARLTQAQTTTNPSGTNAPKWSMHRFGAAPITGTVSGISGSTITLAGPNNTTYTVDATSAKITKISGTTKAVIQISGIVKGDTLNVSGTVSGTNIAAKTIIDGTLPARPQPIAPTATGTVSNLSGNTFTLTNSAGTAYTVDATSLQNISINKQNTSLQNGSVQNGDIVSVFGALSGGQITATRIMDGKIGIGKMGNVMGK